MGGLLLSLLPSAPAHTSSPLLPRSAAGQPMAMPSASVAIGDAIATTTVSSSSSAKLRSSPLRSHDIDQRRSDMSDREWNGPVPPVLALSPVPPVFALSPSQSSEYSQKEEESGGAVQSGGKQRLRVMPRHDVIERNVLSDKGLGSELEKQHEMLEAVDMDVLKADGLDLDILV